MSGRVFPAGLLPLHRFAVGVQSHKHVLVLVAPLGGSVGVVLVLLDAFDQTAVWTKVPLQERGEIRRVRFSNESELRLQVTDSTRNDWWRYWYE